MKQLIEFNVNGESYEVAIEPHRTLLEMLRENLGLTGTKNGCDEGTCGACTVLLDGKPVLSCLMLATDAIGREIQTIEGQAIAGKLTVLQKAFVEHGAIQCGFCTPGMILSAKALLDRNPKPTDRQIVEAISGNLCRCAAHVLAVGAIKAAAETRGERKDG